MSKHVENVENEITSEVTKLLRGITHGWKFKPQQKPFVGNTLSPDIMAMRDGRETVAIEAKSTQSIEVGVDKMNNVYFGQELEADFQRVSDTLEAGLVIHYPESVQNVPNEDLQRELTHTNELEYCVLTADGEGNFPTEGYATGSLRDIATALHIGASPTKKIEEVAKVYSKGLESWSKRIERSIAKKPALGNMLAEILGQEATEEACKTACIFIIDAFIFQDAVAGKEGFEDVEPLQAYDEPDGKVIRYDNIIADWTQILQVNYVPIFKDAIAIVLAMRKYDLLMARHVLKGLLKTAIDISNFHLQQVQEIGGELFQKLVVDRDYVKAHYTLPVSAALLSALVCPDIDENNLPKVADYACGTGALINGVYKRIQRLYEQKTEGSSVEIHRQMVEENLCASDIFPHATHLTFTTMAACHPTTTLGATRVITAPYGKLDNGDLKTGSLELLDTQQLELRTLGTMADQLIGDDDIAQVDYKREFADGEMDIVIMNPPFSKPSANNGNGGAYTTFQSSTHDHDVQKAMQDKLKKTPTRVYNGQAGFASAFVDVADCKLKRGGTMGFIIPQTMMTSKSWGAVRRMLASEYHDVIVVTLSGRTAADTAFSHDTNMAECIVVATKGSNAEASIPTGRARFVCMTFRPDSLLEAELIASKIRNANGERRLEGAPNGGDELNIGGCDFGRMLDAPIDEREWVVARTNSLSLLQTVYNLSVGQLQLPQLRNAKAIPMTTIGEVGVVGYSEPKIKHPKMGAFDLHLRRVSTQDGYETIWKTKSESRRAMVSLPDYKAQIRVGKEKPADEILERISRTHFNIHLGYNAGSMVSAYTEEPSIGVRSLTDVKLHDTVHDAVWTLWSNSTLGLLCHWKNSGKQQQGRGLYTDSQVPHVPTLDVRELTDEQLAAADRIFAELKDARMLPYNECKSDPWRHVLDARLLAEVLGIEDEETHRAMQRLREMLCAEPTIAGTKLEKNFCNLEKEREKFNLGGTKEEDAEALDIQRQNLQAAGIYLPD